MKIEAFILHLEKLTVLKAETNAVKIIKFKNHKC